MIRGMAGTVVWAGLAAAFGIGLFSVKHEVKDLETQLEALNHEIQQNQEEIHVLNAEWSYLNDPVRLGAQAERHLGMRPVGPAQVATLESLPMGEAPRATAAEAPPPTFTATPQVHTAAAPQVHTAATPQVHTAATPQVHTAAAVPPAPKAKPASAKPAAAKSPMPRPHPAALAERQPQPAAAPARPAALARTPSPPVTGRRIAIVSSPALTASDISPSSGEAR